MEREKGNYSFLIALAKQLGAAVASHRDDDVGAYCESLAVSLDLLLGHFCPTAGGDDGGDDEGIDSDDDDDGDDPTMGSPLAGLPSAGPPAGLVQPSRRMVGGALAREGLAMGGGEPRTPLLTRPAKRRTTKKGKRRGKK